MSSLAPGSGSIRIWRTDGTYFCGTVSLADVNLGLNEHWTANLSMDYELFDNMASSDTITIGQTVDLWLGRLGNLTQIFSGKVGPVREKIEGKEPRWYEFEARGWGEVLNHSNFSGKTTDITIDQAIRFIVENITDSNTLTVNNVTASDTTLDVWEEQEPVSMYDTLTRLCDENDWVFFVDNDKDLWAFPLGTQTSTEDFVNDAIEATYIRDPDRIINAQKVIGAREKQKGLDADWTEDEDNSSCTWSANGGATPYAYSGAKSPNTQHGAGAKVIRTYWSNATAITPYMEILFEEASTPTPVDLSYFGVLQFAINWEFRKNGRTDEVLDLSVYFMKDDSNYWRYDLELPGLDAKRRGLSSNVWEMRYGWHIYNLSFNIRKFRDTEVTVVGTPKFSNISKVRFEVNNPKPTGSDWVEAWMEIDNMSFKEGYFFGEDTDAISINKYGMREGQPIFKESIKSDSSCDSLAQVIVNAYKDPIESFESISGLQVYTLGNVQPGDEITGLEFEDEEGIIGPADVQVRNIHYSLDENFKLSSNFDLSTRYIPSIERILANAVRDIQKLKIRDAFTDIPDAGIFKYGPSALDYTDVDISPDGFSNLILNPGFETQDRYWSPDADVPAAWIANTVPAGASFRQTGTVKVGEISLYFTDGRQFSSWLFPVKWKDVGEPTDIYRFAYWHKGEQDVGSSMKVELILAQEGVGYVDTIDIYDWTDNAINWQYKDIFINMPRSINTGYLRLNINPSYGMYADDVWFSRIISSTDDTGNTKETDTLEDTTGDTWNTIDTFTFAPTVNERYVPDTITFQVQIEGPPDTSTLEWNLRMDKNGNNIYSNFGTSTAYAWEEIEKIPDKDITWGDSIDVHFVIMKRGANDSQLGMRSIDFTHQIYQKNW